MINFLRFLVVTGDATTKEDEKDDSSPAKKEPTTTDKSEQPTFFAKLRKHMCFKNIIKLIFDRKINYYTNKK